MLNGLDWRRPRTHPPTSHLLLREN